MGQEKGPVTGKRWSPVPGNAFLLAAVALSGCATGTSTVSREDSTSSRPSARTTGYAVREATDDVPDVGGMGMQAQQGYLSQEDAEDAIKRRWRELVRCYERAGDASDFAGGPVRLRFMVESSGKPSSVYVLSSLLGNFEVERCLVEIGRSITFTRPQGGAASVEYSLEFRSTGEVPVVDLPPEETAKVLPALITKIAADCQRLGVETAEATLYVSPRGSVRSVGFATTSAPDAEAVACVATAVQKATVPVEWRGRGVGRMVLALRNADVLNPPAPPEPRSRPKVAQGRRGRSRR